MEVSKRSLGLFNHRQEALDNVEDEAEETRPAWLFVDFENQPKLSVNCKGLRQSGGTKNGVGVALCSAESAVYAAAMSAVDSRQRIVVDGETRD